MDKKLIEHLPIVKGDGTGSRKPVEFAEVTMPRFLTITPVGRFWTPELPQAFYILGRSESGMFLFHSQKSSHYDDLDKDGNIRMVRESSVPELRGYNVLQVVGE